MNIYRTYITSSTIMISTKRQKSKFRKVSAADAAGKYDQTIILLHRICIRGLSAFDIPSMCDFIFEGKCKIKKTEHTSLKKSSFRCLEGS